MRPAFWLVLVLVAASALAGCSNPRKPAELRDAQLEFPKVDMADGTEVRYVAAPEWRPGYHFTYEDGGAYEGDSWGTGASGNSSGEEAYSWGPRPGLNYTVVTNEETFGEQRFVAVDDQPDHGGPGLLAFDPQHLEPLAAYIADSCSSFHGQSCTPYISVYGDAESAPPLEFPLRDGQPAKKVVDDVPFLPFGPVLVATRVLGMKEVAGPTGPVQAVHVHQSFVVNLTRASEIMGEDNSAMPDLNLTGAVVGTRDVFYAPSLLNVVLQVTTSEGDYNGTYQRDGQPQSFGESWRRWSSTRLVTASYEETDAMALGELRALLRSGTAIGDAHLADLRLETSAFSVNVAQGEAVQITVTPTPGLNASQVRIIVLNSGGLPADGASGTSLSFAPSRAGPYLIMAYALDDKDRVMVRQYRSLYAEYHAETSVDCSPVAIEGYSGCPTVLLPLSPSIDFLFVTGRVSNAALPVVGQGRIFVDAGDGQQVSRSTSSGVASLFIEAPFVNPDAPDWTLGYQPDPGVAESVAFSIDIYPGSVPAFVYDRAMEYTSSRETGYDDEG